MGLQVKRQGDWKKPGTILKKGSKDMDRALKKIVAKEARLLRDQIRKGIRSQAPGGKAFRKLSPLTIAARNMQTTKTGSRHTRALEVSGELKRGVRALIKGKEAFVGIRKGLTGKDGRPLHAIGCMNEAGSRPISIPITPRMRRFLGALFRKAGGAPSGSGGGLNALVVRIPSRPFIRPVFDAWRKDIQVRVCKELENQLTGLSA